jgi:hypothetical protein
MDSKSKEPKAANKVKVKSVKKKIKHDPQAESARTIYGKGK